MMLCVIFCPQKTVLLTGVFPTVQTYAAGTPSLGSRASGALGLSTLPFTSSTFPLRSTARTWSTCSAGVSPLTGCGELHVVHSGLLGVTGSIAPSSRHWKTRPSVGVWLSLPVKVNVALVCTVVGSGPERISVSGGVVSGGGGWIHQAWGAGVRSLLPTRSTDRTWKMWPPWARLEYCSGDSHGPHSTVSGMSSGVSPSLNSSKYVRHSYLRL